MAGVSVAGAVFGSMLARSADRTGPVSAGAVVGAVLLGIGGVLIAIQRPGFDVFTYWRQPASFAVAIMGVILVWLALCDLASRRRGVDRAFGFFYGWSDRVIAIYFTHWIIVGWGVGLVGLPGARPRTGPAGDGRGGRRDSYLSRFAVKLETSWWQRPGAGRGPSEVAVEVPAA